MIKTPLRKATKAPNTEILLFLWHSEGISKFLLNFVHDLKLLKKPMPTHALVFRAPAFLRSCHTVWRCLTILELPLHEL